MQELLMEKQKADEEAEAARQLAIAGTAALEKTQAYILQDCVG